MVKCQITAKLEHRRAPQPMATGENEVSASPAATGAQGLRGAPARVTFSGDWEEKCYDK